VSSTRSRTEALEAIAYEVWRAPEVEELDGWRLRFAHGLTGRANSVWPNGDGVLPLEEKLARAEAWYRERSVPVLFQVTDAARPAKLDSVLVERGYFTRVAPVSVQTARLDDVVARTGGHADVVDELDDDWLLLWAGERGFDRSRHDVGRALLTAGEVGFARVDGAAIGRGVVVGDWLGITSMATAPDARRRGHGRAVLGALARWGATRGCSHALLQVDSSNEAALGLYARAGFAAQHEYRYRILP
jgi:ribosomal protein S18 acetylase RimI-like enzyme